MPGATDKNVNCRRKIFSKSTKSYGAMWFFAQNVCILIVFVTFEKINNILG